MQGAQKKSASRLRAVTRHRFHCLGRGSRCCRRRRACARHRRRRPGAKTRAARWARTAAGLRCRRHAQRVAVWTDQAVQAAAWRPFGPAAAPRPPTQSVRPGLQQAVVQRRRGRRGAGRRDQVWPSDHGQAVIRRRLQDSEFRAPRGWRGQLRLLVWPLRRERCRGHRSARGRDRGQPLRGGRCRRGWRRLSRVASRHFLVHTKLD